MIIDIVNPFAYRFQYRKENHTLQELYVFTPDDECATKVKKQFENRGFTQQVRDWLADTETETTYILVDNIAQKLQVFREITSHYEIYYYQSPDQNIIVTDHMINMLSYIPKAHRKVNVDGVCDNMLYQHSYGKDTFVTGVYRLGYGESLEIANGKIKVAVMDRLQLNRYDLKGEDGAEVLERSMREVCSKVQKKDCVNTLSGGVDSTLTHIVMGNPKSVSGSYEYEGFLHEKQYALDAAKLLGADHTVYDIELSDYMDLIKKVSEAYGLPPYNLTAQGMHYVLANKVNASQMMVSELAGAVYGLEMRTPYTEETARQYSFDHPYNYVNKNSMIAAKEDFDCIEMLFGKETVKRQLAKRNQYVLDRIQGFDDGDYTKDNCLLLGHLNYWFSNNGVGILEQMENPFGKTIQALFSAKKLVERFLSLDIKNRYEDEKYGEKPYAKQMLEKLLPEYEVNKPKLGGSLPRTWMVTEGPMAGYFLQHDIPEFIEKPFYENMRMPSWKDSWVVKYTIMYSIWDEHVMKKEVPKHPSRYFMETSF